MGTAAACTRKLQQLLTGRPPKHPPGNGTQALSMHRCCQRHSTINSRQHPVLDDVVSSAWGVERSHQRVGRIVDPQIWHECVISGRIRSEEHTSELQSLMRISYADFCLKTNTLTASKTYDK